MALYRDEPWEGGPNFHQPFMNLFNDTFSQLDRLTSDMNSHFTETLGPDWQKSLTRAPKVDIKETDKAYIIEGELPGVERKDIKLDWVDDSTLVLKSESRTEKVSQPQLEGSQAQGRIEGGDAKTSNDVQMSGANKDAAPAADGEKSVTTTNASQDVAKPTEKKPIHHLTERSFSSYQRVFHFPGEVKHDDVKANLKNGVLTVTVPKVVKEAEPEKKSRSVTIEEDMEDAPAAETEPQKTK